MRTGIEFDDGRFDRAKLGFVLLSSEQTIESDMMRWAPEGVGVHFSRGTNPDQITAETLGSMLDSLTPAAAVLAPNAGLDVLCYACTSGSVVLGEDVIREALRAGQPDPQPTTLISGVFAALDAIGARRIAVGTPYVDDINAIEFDYMTAHGYDISELTGLGIVNDSDMVRVRPEYLYDFAVSLDREDVDAIFISCGALRTVDVIEEIEATVNKPVIASNQAMLWHCLRLAGIDDQFDGLGQLVREC